MYLTAFLVCSMLSLELSSSSKHEHWSYHDESAWPRLCLEGQRQSPVNIETSRVLSIPAAPLHYSNYIAVPLVAVNNGHTVQWEVEGADSERPRLGGGPLSGQFVLDQFHLHWLGEHAVDHLKYPVEIHFVHRRPGRTLAQAKQDDNGLVVVAVLCQLTTDERHGEALSDLVKIVPKLVNTSSQIDAGKLNLKPLLGPAPNSYYTYLGSLTTPPCLETVTWIVLDKPITITDQQYRILSSVDVGGITNFRRLQPLLARAVYRPATSSGVTSPPGATSSALAGALLSAVAALYNVTLHKVMDIKKQINITKPFH